MVWREYKYRPYWGAAEISREAYLIMKGEVSVKGGFYVMYKFKSN